MHEAIINTEEIMFNSMIDHVRKAKNPSLIRMDYNKSLFKN